MDGGEYSGWVEEGGGRERGDSFDDGMRDKCGEEMRCGGYGI